VVTVLVGEDTQEDQQLLQNDDHDNDHEEEENNDEEEEEEEEEEGNKAEGEDDEDYIPLSNAENDNMYREIKTTKNEAPIPTGRLRDLLNRLDITTPPEFRIKRVPRLGREEYKAIIEIFSRPNVLSRQKGLAFRATYQDAVANAAWQAITTYNRRYHEELKNILYHLLPQRRKSRFKTYGVKADVPRMLMVHHQNMAVEMSTSLQVAQREIQKLHDQLRDSDVTIRGYQRMVAGEADLYTSDTYTWSATSSGLVAKDEPAVNNHSPSGSHTG
jgi:hypothetical protein